MGVLSPHALEALETWRSGDGGVSTAETSLVSLPATHLFPHSLFSLCSHVGSSPACGLWLLLLPSLFLQPEPLSRLRPKETFCVCVFGCRGSEGAWLENSCGSASVQLAVELVSIALGCEMGVCLSVCTQDWCNHQGRCPNIGPRTVFAQ